MRSIQWVFILLLTSCATHKPTQMSSAHYTDQVFTKSAFIAHDEKGPFKSYLAMNLNYAGFEPLRQEFEKGLPAPLKNRGEAHITVITPPEFDKVLSQKISMKDINQIAEVNHLQDIAFRPLCIGKVQASLKGQMQSAYFVVVDSEKLFELRKKIQELYVSKGGKAQDFNPDLFFPHVTLGYTERDLHYEDGVKKDASSCVVMLEPGPHQK